MSLQEHIGNEMIKRAIEKAIVNDNLSHFYIFSGEDGVGKKNLALEFIKSIYCIENLKYNNEDCISCKKVMSKNHSDVVYIEKEEKKKSIGIDIIRKEVNTTINLPPFESEKKIYFIENAEELTIESQNALLKTIEEPPEYIIFIFITNNINKLLSTVLSRAVVFDCKKLNSVEIRQYIEKNYEILEASIDFYVSMADGNINILKKYIEDENFNILRNALINLLIELESCDLVRAISFYDFFNDNKIYLDDLFNSMMIWYRDLLIYKDTKDFSLIIQQDKKDDIMVMSEKFKISNLVKKINIIDNTIKALEFNSNYQITIENMLLSLKEK